MFSVVSTDHTMFYWRDESEDDYGFENVITVYENEGLTVTAIEVPDASVVDGNAPYDTIFLPDQKSALVAISQEFLAAMKDDCDDAEKGWMTVGTFIGHVLTNAMNELLDIEEE